MRPDSYLVVVGHADNIGKEKYNRDLSECRAKNTIQAIRDILGRKFNIKCDEKHIKPIPCGEKLAAKESPTKETPAPKHRRVPNIP